MLVQLSFLHNLYREQTNHTTTKLHGIKTETMLETQQQQPQPQ